MSILCSKITMLANKNSRLRCYVGGVIFVGADISEYKIDIFTISVNLYDTLFKSNTWHITANFVHSLPRANQIVSDPVTIVAVQSPRIISISIVSAIIRTLIVNKWLRIWVITQNVSTVINNFQIETCIKSIIAYRQTLSYVVFIT